MGRLVCILSLLCLLLACNTGPERPPAVSGSFYPSEPRVLQRTVEDFLSRANPSLPEGARLYALLCPHAGYEYSGQVAGYCYKLLKGRQINTVILIGPSHYESFRGVAVYPEGYWRTPLGRVRIDSSLAERLLNPGADVRENTKVFAREHSLEVQVPFLQMVLPDAKIVPLLVGHPTKASFEYLKDALARVLAKRPDVLLVLSSDLSHYHPYDRAKELDMSTIGALQRLSLEDLQAKLSQAEAEMCGASPDLHVLGAQRQ